MVESRQAAKRPWYLVLALLICSGLGACGSTSGWATIELYRGAHFDNHAHDFAHEDNSKAVAKAFDGMLTALDEERPRAFPLAAGELVLGVAMFLFAAAAMTGRGGARRSLVQLTLAQAALVIAAFVLTPKYRLAQIDWGLAQELAKRVEAGEAVDQVARLMPAMRVMYRGIAIAVLVVRSAVAALVVFALTRQRARAYYDGQKETPTEG